MSVHAVYVPGSVAPGSPEAVEAAVVVREKFSFAAFLLPLPWLLFRRAWREFLGFAAVMVAAVIVARQFTGNAPGVLAGLELLAGVFVGLAAPDVRGRALERRGYRLADVVVAESDDGALARFAERDMAGPTADSRPAPETTSASVAPRAERSGVIGLFPEAQR